MASRSATVPEDFLSHLRDSIPGFKLESYKHQFELARMAWIGITKSNQHSHIAGAMTFSYADLNLAFGRSKFNVVNARLNFFNRSPNWSVAEKYTRAYLLSWHVSASIERYLTLSPWTSTTALLMADEKSLKTIPAAVSSKDKSGVTTRAWDNAKSLNLVVVSLGELANLKGKLTAACAELRLSDAAACAATNPVLADVERVVETIGKISRLAMTVCAGENRVAHHYQEAQSGRLYPIGISLASAQTVVKDAALTGNWEYDISNCHYAIFSQMASKSGKDCPAIQSYLKDKTGTRNAVASQAGITLRQAKTCLVALMYGARASVWHENAIPREIGADAAKRLNASPAFALLKNDIEKARKVILSKWPRTPKDWKMNAFGKAISGEAKAAQQMAHLLQGVEAKALQAVINLHPADIVLVQHDGFVSTRKLVAKDLSAAVFSATEYRLDFEEKQLKADIDKYFSDRYSEGHSKMEEG